MKRIIEICANSAQSCVEAEAGGAKRVELCAGIPEGGTTPSYGEIKTAREITSTIDINVIIRPRGGDFLYTPAEVQSMLADIEICKQLQVHGVVFGCLTKEGDIDIPLMRKLIDAAFCRFGTIDRVGLRPHSYFRPTAGCRKRYSFDCRAGEAGRRPYYYYAGLRCAGE